LLDSLLQEIEKKSSYHGMVETFCSA